MKKICIWHQVKTRCLLLNCTLKNRIIPWNEWWVLYSCYKHWKEWLDTDKVSKQISKQSPIHRRYGNYLLMFCKLLFFNVLIWEPLKKWYWQVTQNTRWNKTKLNSLHSSTKKWVPQIVKPNVTRTIM